MSVCVSWPIGQIRRFVSISNFLHVSKDRLSHRALCALVLAVLFSAVLQTDTVVAQPAEASISVTVPGSDVEIFDFHNIHQQKYDRVKLVLVSFNLFLL